MQSYADDSISASEDKEARELSYGAKSHAGAEGSDVLPPLSKLPPSMTRQIVPRYLQDDASATGRPNAAAPAAADVRGNELTPGPLRAHDRREAAVLLRLANSLPAGLADMAPVRALYRMSASRAHFLNRTWPRKSPIRSVCCRLMCRRILATCSIALLCEFSETASECPAL